jgi:hypothetical protein
MEIDEWWPRLDSGTQEWLIENNGDVVPAAVLDKINRAGGHVTSETPWVGGDGRAGLVLSDTAIDWIEQAANDET